MALAKSSSGKRISLPARGIPGYKYGTEIQANNNEKKTEWIEHGVPEGCAVVVTITHADVGRLSIGLSPECTSLFIRQLQDSLVFAEQHTLEERGRRSLDTLTYSREETKQIQGSTYLWNLHKGYQMW